MYCDRGEVKITRATNGYTLVMRDPAIDKANAKRSLTKDGERTQPYVEPTKVYVFEDFDSLSKFLEKNLDKALPAETYESSFEALADED